MLTQRERSVLDLIARGMSNRQIGDQLHLTEGTVKGYVSTILAKLKLEDRTQAALFAVQRGLAKPHARDPAGALAALEEVAESDWRPPNARLVSPDA